MSHSELEFLCFFLACALVYKQGQVNRLMDILKEYTND